MKGHLGSPLWLSRLRIWLVSIRMQVQSLDLLSWLRIQCSCELWHSLQTHLGSGIAVAVALASSWSSNLTPSLETSIWHKCGPKKAKRKKKKRALGEIQKGCCTSVYQISTENTSFVDFHKEIFMIKWKNERTHKVEKVKENPSN